MMLDEVYRVPQSWFKGGAEDLVRGVDAEKMRAYFRNTRPLPGHKTLRYNILNQGPYTEIVLIDPRVKTRPIANLTLRLKKTFPVANSYEIAVAIVDERYRGQGLIFAMYDIVLDKLQGHLVSSTTQTPGGRKIWTSLIQDPRIEVQGVAYVPTRSFTNQRLINQTIEEIMKVGAVYLGASTNRKYHAFAFPVESVGDELANAIPDSRIQVYNAVTSIIKTGLMASRR